MSDTIKVGFLIDGNIMPAWVYNTIEKIIALKSAEVVFIVKNKSEVQEEKCYFEQPLRMYLNFERFLFTLSQNAFENKNISGLSGVSFYEIETVKKDADNCIEDKDIEYLKIYKADVIINLSSTFVSSDFVKAADFGVWYYQHGSNIIDDKVSAGFWEVIERKSETSATLNMVSSKFEKNCILEKGYYQTDKWSLLINNNSLYWKASDLIANELESLYNLGIEKYAKIINEKNMSPEIYSNRRYTAPGVFDIASFFISNLFHRFFSKIKSLILFEQWILVYTFKESESIEFPMYKYKKIIPPKDRFWADPFIYVRDGKNYIFFEELIYKENKGNISVLELKEDGTYTNPVVVLEKDYHLSYPFIFEDNGVLFMIPETVRNNKIDLYRCSDFPLVWEFEKTLINNVQAADTTMYKKDNIYWIFCNVKKNNYNSTTEELFIYYSESLFSDDWKKHPRNPVVIDVRTSRPAGKLFEYNGSLYRPSQNCASRYGYAFTLNKVLEISTDNYIEMACEQVSPMWEKSIVATHTFNSSKELLISDAKMLRFKFFN